SGVAGRRAGVPGPFQVRATARGLCVAGRPRRHRNRGDRAVGRSRPRPQTGLCDRPNLRRLGLVWHIRPDRSGWDRGVAFSPRLRRGSDDRADGGVATRTDPGVPGAIVRYTALGRAVSVAATGIVLIRWAHGRRVTNQAPRCADMKILQVVLKPASNA